MDGAIIRTKVRLSSRRVPGQVWSAYRVFRLYRRGPNGFTRIAGPTRSEAINTGRVSNRLTVTREGNQITLHINGRKLSTWWDAEMTGLSGVGLVSSAYKDGGDADARFVNFGVVSLPTNGASAQGAEGTEARMPEPRTSETQIEPMPVDLGW